MLPLISIGICPLLGLLEPAAQAGSVIKNAPAEFHKRGPFPLDPPVGEGLLGDTGCITEFGWRHEVLFVEVHGDPLRDSVGRPAPAPLVAVRGDGVGGCKDRSLETKAVVS